MRSNNILILFKTGLLFTVILMIVFLPNFFVRSESSSDAIAIRVIPNPGHLSALRWYYDQGFTGSPQSTIVDGYQAVRDGRTVYVNVANIDAGNLFTNVYLISYNQDAQSATVDIFSKILSNWKFNTNINSIGFCRKEPGIFCLKDEGCPIGDFCDSKKARIIRDVRRLADLADIGYLADNYYADSGHYPILSAGTYLPHRTISVWPSWKDEFSRALGRSLPVDPVNKLGPCTGYNEITCWDEYTRTFVINIAAWPDLPDNSLAYIYTSDPGGNTASYCAVLESGLAVQGNPACSLNVCLDFDSDGWGNPASSDCPNSGLDCNDNDASVQAGGDEICGDGIDNDCDGLTDCADADCVGASACSIIPFCGDGSCGIGEDCHNCGSDCGSCPVTCPNGVCDASSECPTGSNPCSADCYCSNGAIECGEECDDGNNNNGDGCSSVCQIEPPCIDDDSDGYDACGSGGLPVSGCDNPCDCRDDSPGINPGESDICDGVDNDCNSATADGSGETAPPNDIQAGECAGNKTCMGVSGWQDSYKATYQLTESACADGLDNDCDGDTDCDDSNCTGNPACGPNCGTNGCETGENCNNCPADCGACCGNGTCDDIYGELCGTCPTDCGACCEDSDGDGYDACDTGTGLPVSGCGDPCDCNDAVGFGFINPGRVETCDGYDNDCDGQIDEGCDVDGDGYCDSGMQIYNNNDMCPNTVFTGNGMWGNDCDDTNKDIHPGATEICDGIDNDCDAGTLDGSGEVPKANPLDLGVCAGTNQACVSGSWQPSYPAAYQATEANCTDGLDNDCDGLNDCYDTDCQCNCIFTLILPCEFL